MILLDTHALVWLVLGDDRLGKTARGLIRDEDRRRISAMLSWKLATLADKGRLLLEMPVGRWMDENAKSAHLVEVPVTGAIACDAGSLPGKIHGDPCDRIMIATARSLGCPILTSDRKILAYADQSYVHAIDARW